MNVTTATDRVAISLQEARLEHGLSQRQLAALSRVSASTIRKAERGGRIDSVLFIRLVTALVALDVFGPGYVEEDTDFMLEEALDRRRPATFDAELATLLVDPEQECERGEAA